jgi:hypothetical protein
MAKAQLADAGQTEQIKRLVWWDCRLSSNIGPLCWFCSTQRKQEQDKSPVESFCCL